MRRAGLFCPIFAVDVVHGVLLEWNSRIAALLRAVVNQTVFANVKVTSPGAALPFVLDAVRDIVLKIVHTGIIFLAHLSYFQIDTLLKLR